MPLVSWEWSDRVYQHVDSLSILTASPTWLLSDAGHSVHLHQQFCHIEKNNFQLKKNAKSSKKNRTIPATWHAKPSPNLAFLKAAVIKFNILVFLPSFIPNWDPKKIMLCFIFELKKIHWDIHRSGDCIIRIQGQNSSSTATTHKETLFSLSQRRIWICAELISLIRRQRGARLFAYWDTADCGVMLWMILSIWSLWKANANSCFFALLKHKINKNQL